MHYTTLQTQQRLTLAPTPLAQGGEGAIHTVQGRPDLVAKLYTQHTAARARKLQAMIAAPPVDPEASRGGCSIAWPTDLLTDAQGGTVGVLMPRVTGQELQFLLRPQLRQKALPAFTYEALLVVGHNLAAAYEAVHQQGHAICDTNPLNSLVDDQGRVTLVDCDSMQVVDPATGRVHRCPVGVDLFTPPEYQGRRYDSYDSGPGHDAFGLAVLLFMLLMEGTHPFAGRPNPQKLPKHPLDRIADRIGAGAFPYLKATAQGYQPRPASPPLTLLSPALRQLVSTCFVDGHADPDQRPSATAWQAALADELQHLNTCSHHNYHRYPAHLATCPWCERQRRLRIDPFGPLAPPPPTPPRRPQPRPAPPVSPTRTPAQWQGWLQHQVPVAPQSPTGTPIAATPTKVQRAASPLLQSPTGRLRTTQLAHLFSKLTTAATLRAAPIRVSGQANAAVPTRVNGPRLHHP
ncbi:MAG: hypothetical protein AAFX41_00695 [Bacteroidota bacterium]